MHSNIEGSAAVNGVQAPGDVELGSCYRRPTTFAGSTPQAHGSSREEVDDFRGFIADLNGDRRSFGCRADTQWILQRRVDQRHGAGPWASFGFHCSRETLKGAAHRRCGRVAPEAAAVIELLPEMFPERGTT